MSIIQKYSGYLICTDIDGTLTDSKGELPENNLKAIRYFQQNGGLFTVSTGRLQDFVMGLPFVPNAPVIVVNGTVIYDMESGQILHDFPMDCYYEDAIAYIEENHFEYLLNYEAYCLEKYVPCEKQTAKESVAQLAGCLPYKFLFRFYSPERAAAMAEDLNSRFGSRFSFDRSWPQGVEMHIKGSGKGDCVRLLKEKYCPGIHTVIAVGDFENDISMIKAADIGYATANAPDHVKKVAGRIAPSNDEDAIAYIIEAI